MAERGNWKKRIVSSLRGIIYAENVNNLPAKVMASLFFIMLLNAMTITTPFAFVPRLVKSFGTSEVETGYKVGVIACSMFVSRIGFSFLWGYLADKYNSKKIALVSATCLGTSTLAFSFTFNFPWAVVTRFLQGMSMGLIVITKKILAEFCDDTNYSLGIAILIGSFSFGLVLGPSLGGFMAFPNQLYPNVFPEDSIFAKFGVLLPCGFLSIIFYAVIVLFWFWIPNKSREDKYEPIESTESSSTETEESILLQNIKTSFGEYDILMVKYDSNDSHSNKKSKSKKFKFSETILGKLFRNKVCLLACLLYALSLTLAVNFDEALPLYAATAKDYGGFGFTTVDIGFLLMIVAMTTLILQFTILPRIERRYGARKVYLAINVINVFIFPLVPLCNLIENRKLFWIALVCCVLGIRLCLTLGFIANNIFVNNSVSIQLVGTASGFAVSISNIGRAIGVTSIGGIYGWSLTNVQGVSTNNHPLGFPVNQYFIFFIFSIFSLICGLCVFFLPKTIDKPLETSRENSGKEDV